MDSSEVGGTALVGISKTVIKAHGSSNAYAFQNAIRQASQSVSSGLIENITANIDLMRLDATGKGMIVFENGNSLLTATLFVHIVGTEKVLEHSKRSRLVMIFEKLSALIAEQFNVDPDTITMDTSFEDDLNADSVDIVDLSMALEEEFGIEELGEAEATSITTVGDLVRLIQSKID